MRHHTHHVSGCVADTGDITQGSIGIGFGIYHTIGIAVTEQHLVIGFELVESGFIGEITPFTVSNRNFQGFINSFAFEVNILTNELLISIAQQYAGQQMCFAENLEAITNSQYLTAFIGEFDYALHHGTEAGHGTAAQVITIREAAGQYNTIVGGKGREIPILMPKHDYFLAQILLEGILHISVTVGTGKSDYTKLHVRLN